MSKTFRQSAVEELYANQYTQLFVQSVFQAQYNNQLVHLPFFTAQMCPGSISMLRQTLLPGFVLSVISQTQFDVVVPLFATMGRIRVTLANVDRYKGQFKQALAFSKASLGFEPVNDRLRWVSVKILAEERLPDVIGSIVTVDGRDLGREMVETGLMVRFDPTRTAPPIPKVPLVTGVYAHEKEEEAAVEEPKAQAHPEEKEWGGERRPRRYRKVRDGRLKE